MSRFSLSRVVKDLGDEGHTGWTGYVTPEYVKQWYFVEGVMLGYAEAQVTQGLYAYSLGREYHGSFSNLDEAKEAFMVKLKAWANFKLMPTIEP